MEDVAGVIVEGEYRTVGIPTVSDIPFLHLAASGVHPELVILCACLGEEALDGG